MVEESPPFSSFGNHWGSRLDIVHQQLLIQSNLNALAVYGHTHPERLLIWNQLLVHIPESIERTGSFPFQVPAFPTCRVVDLHFETLLGKAGFLISRVKVDAGVTVWLGRQFHFELEVSEVRCSYRARVKQMRTRPISGERTIKYFPRAFVLARLPTVQGVAIKKIYPLFPPGCDSKRGSGYQAHQSSSADFVLAPRQAFQDIRLRAAAAHRCPTIIAPAGGHQELSPAYHNFEKHN